MKLTREFIPQFEQINVDIKQEAQSFLVRVDDLAEDLCQTKYETLLQSPCFAKVQELWMKLLVHIHRKNG